MTAITPFFPRGAWIAALLFLAGLLPVSATTLLDEPFDTPGGLPEGWAFVNSNGTATVQVTEYQPNDARLLQGRPVSGGAAGSVISYSGTQGDVVGGVLKDFEGSVVFALDGTLATHYRGVLLRAQTTVITNAQAYFVVFNSSTLSITLNPASSSNLGTTLATATFENDATLAENTDYLLRFSAEGNQLTASIDGWNETTGQYDTPLGDIHYTIGTHESDPGYLTGKFGFRTYYGSGAGTYWSDLKITTIPEPASLTLLGLALTVAALRFRSAGRM